MPKSPAVLRYNRRVIWNSLVYTVLLLSTVYAFKHHLLSGPLAYVAAILPALAIIGFFVAIGRYLIEEQDEYLRMLMVRQSLWASGFALSIATIWGFLEGFDLVTRVDSYYVAVLWFVGLGLGALANKLTIGSAS
jgi:hypothetical protein